MKVSVIIPVYNVEKYIKNCINSVINQTYKSIEIVIVNDCTPDNSIMIVESLLVNSTRDYKIVSNDINKGLSVTRNTGVLSSTGEYLFFLDGDDDLPLDSLSLLVECAKKFNPDVVVGNVKVIGKPNWIINRFDVEYCENYELISKELLTGGINIMACNKLIKKEFFVKNKLWFYERILHEDLLWNFNLSRVISSISIVKQETYNYYIRQQSITQNKSIKNIKSVIDILKIIESEICESHNLHQLNYVESFGFMALHDCIKIGLTKCEIKSMSNEIYSVIEPNYIHMILNFQVKRYFKNIVYKLPVPVLKIYYNLISKIVKI